MRNVGRLIWDLAISRNLAIVLLAIIAALLILGAVLPNPALLTTAAAERIRSEHPVAFWLGERLNSQKIAEERVFGFIGVFLILSTVLCSLDRLIKRYTGAGPERRYVFPEIALSARLTGSGDACGTRADALSRAEEWFRAGRWKVIPGSPDERFLIAGVKGDVGFWGSVLFHIILITLLTGLAAYYLGAYRARIALTEGQELDLADKGSFTSVAREPVWGLRPPKVSIGLIRSESTYDPDNPWNAVDHRVLLRLRDRDGLSRELEIRINHPLTVDGRKILLTGGGYSPRVLLTDAAGMPLFDSYVALREDEGRPDRFRMPRPGLHVEARIFPDFMMKDGAPSTASYQARNPVLGLTLLREGRVVYNGLLKPGAEERVGDYRIAFPDMRNWVSLEMVGEPGMGFFFWASFVGVAGILLRTLDPDERLYIVAENESDDDVAVVPFSKHFSAMLEDKAVSLLDHIRQPNGKNAV